MPGNAGMYDVVNALTWTNKYIKYFGGDPNKIKIAGQVSRLADLFLEFFLKKCYFMISAGVRKRYSDRPSILSIDARSIS